MFDRGGQSAVNEVLRSKRSGGVMDRDRGACILFQEFAGASQRGTCSAEWSQDEDGSMMYRCSGEASVWCR